MSKQKMQRNARELKKRQKKNKKSRQKNSLQFLADSLSPLLPCYHFRDSCLGPFGSAVVGHLKENRLLQ